MKKSQVDPGANVQIYINACQYSAANAGKYLTELIFASFGRFHENQSRKIIRKLSFREIRYIKSKKKKSNAKGKMFYQRKSQFNFQEIFEVGFLAKINSREN